MPNKRKCFVIDFDETVTVHDTIKNIVQAGIQLNRGNLPSTVTYKNIEDFYVKTYRQLNSKKGSHLPNAWDQHHAHRLCNVTLKYINEYNYQSFLKPYEDETLQNIVNCDIFKGVSVDALVKTVTPELEIRSGFNSFLGNSSDLLKEGLLYVLSLNFSKELICNVVKGLAQSQVYCNYLETSGDVKSDISVKYNGKLNGKILVGSDKSDVLFDMFGSDRTFESSFKAGSEGAEVWYIGDSRSDYLSILHPLVNVGFLLIDEQNTDKFQKCCDFFKTGKLGYGDITATLYEAGWLPSDTCKRVYLVKGWHEIISLARF